MTFINYILTAIDRPVYYFGMARIRNEERYTEQKNRLLEIGVDLLIRNSFHSVGINQVLQEAQIPRGSFYHYFESKDGFALETLHLYHQQQLDFCRSFLFDNCQRPLSPVDSYHRLKAFYTEIIGRLEKIEYTQGCLMSNLSMEIADNKELFREHLRDCWNELCELIGEFVHSVDMKALNLNHLSELEASNFLMNAWSGALLRMKVEKSPEPLKLFLRAVFRE